MRTRSLSPVSETEASAWTSHYVILPGDYSRFLTEYVEPVAQTLMDTSVTRRFFFIRYWDGEMQLRIRFCPARHTSVSEAEPIVASRLREAVERFETSHEFSQTTDRPGSLRTPGRVEAVPYSRADYFGNTPASVYAELVNETTSWIALRLLRHANNRLERFILLVASLHQLLGDSRSARVAQFARRGKAFAERYLTERPLTERSNNTQAVAPIAAIRSASHALRPDPLHDHGRALLRRLESSVAGSDPVITHALHLLANKLGFGFDTEYAAMTALDALATSPSLMPRRSATSGRRAPADDSPSPPRSTPSTMPSPTASPSTSDVPATAPPTPAFRAALQDDRLADAETIMRNAIRLDPDRAAFWNNLGLALHRQERFGESVEVLRHANELKPNAAPILLNLAYALFKSDQIEASLDTYRQLIDRAPTGKAYNGYGLALGAAHQHEDAIAAYEAALRLRPDWDTALANRGISEFHLHRFAEAEKSFRAALAINESIDSDSVHMWLMEALHLTGQHEEAWTHYEHRHALRETPMTEPNADRWDGRPFHGKTLLVTSEQGFGDQIHFVRYLNEVKSRGGRVLLECLPPLLRLFDSVEGVDDFIARGAEPNEPVDFWIPLCSLPGLLGMMPASGAYLEPARDDAERWSILLRSVSELCVGVNWEGKRSNVLGRHRAIDPAAFAALSDLPGIRLFSLQKGPGRDALDTFPCPITDLGTYFEDFADTAAAMRSLDLVLTNDTSVAHLAGATGTPVWTILPRRGCWRWGRDATTPWYPSMRLFRQSSALDWRPVLDEVAAALRQTVRDASTGSQDPLSSSRHQAARH